MAVVPLPPVCVDSPQSILIIRLSAIGDVVHTLPCVHALRLAFPEARIGWLVEELSAPLLSGHPEIDELFVIPKKRWRAHPATTVLNGERINFYRRLRAREWEVAIDFQGLTKSGIPLWLSGARTRIGFGDADGREINKVFTNRKVVPSDRAPHVIQRNLALLEPLGIRVEADDGDCRFPDFSEERKGLAFFFEALRCSECIVLYPGAGWETKRWPLGHFADLARLLSDAERCPAASRFPMVLVWGPGEDELCQKVMRQAKLPPERLRLAPATNLRELAALLECAALVIGGDTGPVHLAAALRRRVVGIYGGSDPVRNGPWGAANRHLMAAPPSCVACWRRVCNHDESLQCLRSIKPDQVATVVEALLGS